MAAPDSMKVEVEGLVTVGVWTDVTAYVDWSAGGSTKFGRSSQYSAPQPATLTLTLDNTDGRFTPLRQTLIDGTAHPYYPNVVPRKRIRFGYVITGVTYYVFTGYVKGWPPLLKDRLKPRVQIDATDRLDRFNSVQMQSQLLDSMVDSAPELFWPLTDSEGSDQGVEYSGGPPLVAGITGGAPLQFGADGPSNGNGTGVQFSPSSQFTGQQLSADARPLLAFSDWTFSLFAKLNVPLSAWAGPGAQVIAAIMSGTNSAPIFDHWIGTSAGDAAFGLGDTGTQYVIAADLADGEWHYLTLVGNNTTNQAKFYVDGVLRSTQSLSHAAGGSEIRKLALGDGSVTSDVWGSGNRFTGNIGYVALWDRALTGGELQDHYIAFTGGAGETVDERMERFLGYAGLTAADWNLDASAVTLGSYDQAGKDVFTGLQDMAISEGGGAVVYVAPDGDVRFTNRDFRGLNTTPALTLDAAADLDGDAFTPAYDDTTIVNHVEGSRATAAGSGSTQVVEDATSIAAFDLTTESFTSYAATDDDVLFNAQDRLATQRTPAYRLQRVTVDMFSATTAGLYAAVAAVEIGDRIRVTNLYAGAAPTSQVDVMVEGWAHSFSNAGYVVTFDTSPADNPPTGVFDTAVFQPADDCALNAAITNSATTVVIKCPTGPTFTTTGGDYPLTIKVGEEQIRLNSAPGGSTSPQTFTGVTRGVNTTTAAAQVINAPVTLQPATTYGL